MISGLYTAASGLIAQLQQQDVIANNIANVNTTGYKKDTALYVPFPEMFLYRINDAKVPVPGGVTDAFIPVGMVGRGVQLRVDGIRPDFITEGSYIETGNKMDLAIKGNGMFVVMTPQGIRYTRDGSFSIDAEGTLVTKDGFPVLGQRGTITVNGGDVRVDEAGRVFVDNNEIDTLRIAIFSKEDVLRKQGNNLFYLANGNLLPEDSYVDYVKIKQGYLETSNVNVIREMVDMITAYRAYEAAQKSIQSQDQTLNKVINDVGNIQI